MDAAEAAEIANVANDFPSLVASGAFKTSDQNGRYNCIAYAAGVMNRLWWPGAGKAGHWPQGVPGTVTMTSFVAAFGTKGYAPCPTGDLEVGFLKVALYASGDGTPTHAARQLPSGRWTSKLGKTIDIEHDLADVEGPQYGAVAMFLRRRIPVGA